MWQKLVRKMWTDLETSRFLRTQATWPVTAWLTHTRCDLHASCSQPRPPTSATWSHWIVIMPSL